MDVLLSIKPEFAEMILSGEKRYEFRKTRFRDPAAVDRVFLYATSPIQQIVGAFTFNDVIADSPDRLWDRFCEESGIESYDRFADYFDGAGIGYAIEIEESIHFEDQIDPWERVEDFRPPVSFRYVDEEERQLIEE